MQPIISIRNASKTFGQEVVVNNVSVDFEVGLIHGIVGRNGSGKTVLMRLITGLYRLTAGEIRVRGQRVGIDVEFPSSMGILIESPGFLPFYSGYQNLKILMNLEKDPLGDTIETSMQLVGLDSKSKKHVAKYSLGMKQRLGIAQALMNNPEILLFDEPMNGLDKEGVGEMRELFKALRNQGKTILLASHNQADIDQLCDTVHEIEKGVLTQCDSIIQNRIEY